MLVHRRGARPRCRDRASRCSWSPTWCTSELVSGHFARAQHQLGEFSAGVHESFEGVQLVKSYGAEERETERLSGLADQVRVSRVHALRLRSWFEAFLDVIPSLTNILLVVIGSLRVRSGDLSIGELSGVDLPLHPAGLPAAPDRLRPLRAPSLDRRVEPDPDGAPTSRSTTIPSTGSPNRPAPSGSPSTTCRSPTRRTARRRSPT